MQNICMILFFLNINLVLSLDENPTIFKNNFNSFFDDTCVHSKKTLQFDSINGVSYYLKLDTTKYQNQNIGYILDDLSNKFILLEVRAFNGWERFKKEDFYIRSHFSLYLKIDDSTAIVVRGCISENKIFYEEDEEIAIQKMLEIDCYILNAYQINMKMRYKNLMVDYDNEDESISAMIKERVKELLQDFPALAK